MHLIPLLSIPFYINTAVILQTSKHIHASHGNMHNPQQPSLEWYVAKHCQVAFINIAKNSYRFHMVACARIAISNSRSRGDSSLNRFIYCHNHPSKEFQLLRIWLL
ncbi:hypothetical protein RTP6_005174 [Batrachochytrium dendrobatidis]